MPPFRVTLRASVRPKHRDALFYFARNRFVETMVIGYECARAKPHPDPYLEGLSRLGLSADACVAFEDSVNGVSSAVSADLYTIGVGERSQEKLRGVGAGLCVADYLDSRLLSALGFDVKT